MPAREMLTILYVRDLPSSKAFYDHAFGWQSTVDVINYAEYQVCNGARLGLMPQSNTAGFLGDELGSRTPADGCPRAELYLSVDEVEPIVDRLTAIGAPCTSSLQQRDWGDRAAYFLDPDGYVLAVADRPINSAQETIHG